MKKSIGGWKGWRTFTISEIKEESDEIKSFYLKATDKKEIINYLPGQFITIKTFIPELGYEQPRQYSLSTSYNSDFYRISVKKELASKITPKGLVSNHMHNKKTGDEIFVSAPAGIFHTNLEDKKPMVLIGGGVGVTPLMSMLQTNSEQNNPNQTIWMQACRNENVHPFKDEIANLEKDNQWLKTFFFHEQKNKDNHEIIEGRIDVNNYASEILIEDAKYYICGPEIFIKTQYISLIELGISPDAIFYEEFGPSLISLN